jgi:hypothetical protein
MYAWAVLAEELEPVDRPVLEVLDEVVPGSPTGLTGCTLSKGAFGSAFFDAEDPVGSGLNNGSPAAGFSLVVVVFGVVFTRRGRLVCA